MIIWEAEIIWNKENTSLHWDYLGLRLGMFSICLENKADCLIQKNNLIFSLYTNYESKLVNNFSQSEQCVVSDFKAMYINLSTTIFLESLLWMIQNSKIFPSI